jgi:hypothetical protein
MKRASGRKKHSKKFLSSGDISRDAPVPSEPISSGIFPFHRRDHPTYLRLYFTGFTEEGAL